MEFFQLFSLKYLNGKCLFVRIVFAQNFMSALVQMTERLLKRTVIANGISAVSVLVIIVLLLVGKPGAIVI